MTAEGETSVTGISFSVIKDDHDVDGDRGSKSEARERHTSHSKDEAMTDSVKGAESMELGQNGGAPHAASEEETAATTPSEVPHLHIERPVYTQTDFDQDCSPSQRSSKTVRQRLPSCSKFTCSPSCVANFIKRLFPFLGIMKDYRLRTDLVNDTIAGLTVGIMQIPQGMAYGLLASVAPIVGLYVSFFPGIIYFFFGTSRHVNIGTFAVISLMVGSVVDRYDCDRLASTQSPSMVANTTDGHMTVTPGGLMENFTTGFPSVLIPGSQFSPEMECKISIATAVTMATGLVQIVMGVFHLGFVTIYLSEPLTRGFTTGCAIHVFTSQIKYIFGINVQRYSGAFKIVKTYIELFSEITTTNVAALVVAIICIIILYLTKEYVNPHVKAKIKMPIPVELIVVVLATLVSYLMKLNANYDVAVVGVVPTGIPPPVIPPLNIILEVIPDAISIAVVAFAISVSMVKIFSKKHDYMIDPNQELIAYGLTNSISSLFNCFVSAVSLTRTLIQESLGGKTQLAAVISCSLVLIVLFAIGPLFEDLPSACLAAIILVALKGMFLQFKDLPPLWRVDKLDFMIWMVAFLATAVLDVDIGLIVAVAFSLLTVIFRTQRPHSAVLGRVPHTDIYKDKKIYKMSKEIPGIKIFRFEASLYYANQEHFMQKLYSKTGVNPRKMRLKMVKAEKKKQKQENLRKRNKQATPKELEASEISQDMESSTNISNDTNVHSIILDCTTMGYVDSVGVSTLKQVISEYSDINIKVYLTGCKAGVRETLDGAGFYDKVGKNTLYLTVHDAVVASLEHDPDMLAEEVPLMSEKC